MTDPAEPKEIAKKPPRIGDDAFADKLVRGFEDYGADVRRVRRTENRSSCVEDLST